MRYHSGGEKVFKNRINRGQICRGYTSPDKTHHDGSTAAETGLLWVSAYVTRHFIRLGHCTGRGTVSARNTKTTKGLIYAFSYRSRDSGV
jgi:hypothetical protein